MSISCDTTEPYLIDSHCHLADLDQASHIIQAAQHEHIRQCLVFASHQASWPKVWKCAQQHGVYAGFGLHPWWTQQAQQLALVKPYLQNAVAIGECGLDARKKHIPQHAQENLFLQHLELARLYQKPLSIHAVGALDRILFLLRQAPDVQAVLHDFNGSLQQALALCRHGYHLGVSGRISWPKAERLRKTLAQLPSHCLLLETDAPYQYPYQGSASTPIAQALKQTLSILAHSRQCNKHDLAWQCTRNTQRLFRLQACT